MDASASLKQTVTHLFDSVRYSNHAKELEEGASQAEGELEAQLNRLESHVEEITNLLESMKPGTEDAVREFSSQVEEFLVTAKLQATEKLRKRADEEARELREAAASEHDKALKSLETYLASDPLPVLEHTVHVRLAEGAYEAWSKYNCEGGIKYEFRLATQNSEYFSKEFTLSQLGFELRIPVRLSKALLKKASVPGFERLDQYLLASAEATSGKVRATFENQGNGAKIKIVTSGSGSDGFVGIEYADGAHQVNVMTDPSLSAHVDLGSLRHAMGDLVLGTMELSLKKVALIRLSLGEDEPLAKIDSQKFMQLVLNAVGSSYKAALKKIASGTEGGDSELSLDFIRERLRVLGASSGPVSNALGFQALL